MEQQIFCDGIGRISIIGGIVRLDLFTYSPSETDANGSPRPILSHRIVMGTDGFLRSSEKVLEAVKVIGRSRPEPGVSPAQPAPWPPQQSPAPPQAAPPPPPPPPAAAPEASPPKSPPAPPARPPFP